MSNRLKKKRVRTFYVAIGGLQRCIRIQAVDEVEAEQIAALRYRRLLNGHYPVPWRRDLLRLPRVLTYTIEKGVKIYDCSIDWSVTALERRSYDLAVIHQYPAKGRKRRRPLKNAWPFCRDFLVQCHRESYQQGL